MVALTPTPSHTGAHAGGGERCIRAMRALCAAGAGRRCPAARHGRAASRAGPRCWARCRARLLHAAGAPSLLPQCSHRRQREVELSRRPPCEAWACSLHLLGLHAGLLPSPPAACSRCRVSRRGRLWAYLNSVPCGPERAPAGGAGLGAGMGSFTPALSRQASKDVGFARGVPACTVLCIVYSRP